MEPLENLTSYYTTMETQNEQKQSRLECPDPAGTPDLMRGELPTHRRGRDAASGDRLPVQT